MTDQEANAGCGGFCIGLFIAFMIFAFILLSMRDDSNTLETLKILTPDIKLTTDGKTIDTVYIYEKPPK